MSDDKDFINKILARQDTSADDIKACSTQSSNGISKLKHSDGTMSLNESYIGITHHNFTKKEETKQNKVDDE